MSALAEKAGCTPEQALYRLAQDMGITPLAGSTSEQHMKDGVLVQNLPNLDPALSQDLLKFLA